MRGATMRTNESQIPKLVIPRPQFADTGIASARLIVRAYLGALWPLAGWGKVDGSSGEWIGQSAVPVGAVTRTRALRARGICSESQGNERPTLQGHGEGRL
jgi:hypothetical protein